jgi:hypothetical protein
MNREHRCLSHSSPRWRDRISDGIVTCKSCGSDKQSKFTAEIAIHFPGLSGLEKPIVWVFPKLLVCLNCGTAEFAVPEAELCVLARDASAAAG